MKQLLLHILAAMTAICVAVGVANAAQLTQQHVWFSGDQVKSIWLNADFSQLTNGHNDQDTRLTAVESRFMATLLGIANGGTGASSPLQARINLGAAARGANSDITSLTGLTTPLPATEGGTGLSNLLADRILYTPSANIIDQLVVSSSLGISSGTLSVTPNTTLQKVEILNNGTPIGTRKTLNLIPGSNVTLTTTDNSGNDRVDVTVSASSTAGYPAGYHGSAAPAYASPTTFTVAHIRERSSDDLANIGKNTLSTVDISTTGLNGIAQSANLTGTVTVTSGSTAVTFSTSQTGSLVVGDVLTTSGGQSRILTAVSGTSGTVSSQFTTTETTVTFKRGGRPSFYTASTSGQAGFATLYLYAISDGTTPGLILSTRNVAGGQTLVDLPSGYTFSRQLPFWATLSNTSTAAGVYVGNIMPFAITSGWPVRPAIIYTGLFTINITSPTAGPTNLTISGTSAAFTSLSTANLIPSGAAKILLLNIGNTGSIQARLRASGDTTEGVEYYANAVINPVQVTLSSSGAVEYRKLAGPGALVVDIAGGIVTEIP